MDRVGFHQEVAWDGVSVVLLLTLLGGRAEERELEVEEVGLTEGVEEVVDRVLLVELCWEVVREVLADDLLAELDLLVVIEVVEREDDMFVVLGVHAIALTREEETEEEIEE